MIYSVLYRFRVRDIVTYEIETYVTKNDLNSPARDSGTGGRGDGGNARSSSRLTSDRCIVDVMKFVIFEAVML